MEHLIEQAIMRRHSGSESSGCGLKADASAALLKRRPYFPSTEQMPKQGREDERPRSAFPDASRINIRHSGGLCRGEWGALPAKQRRSRPASASKTR